MHPRATRQLVSFGILAVLSLTLSCLSGTAGAGTEERTLDQVAGGAEVSDAEAAVEAVGAVPGLAAETADRVSTTPDGSLLAQAPGLSIEIPTDPSEGATVRTADGSSMTLVPLAADAGDAATSGGLMSFSADDGTAAVIQPTEEGVRALTVIADADAPREFSYEVLVDGDPAQLVIDGTGGVTIAAPGRQSEAYIQPPWAQAADGRSVPTSYRVNGSTLTQQVLHDEDTAFPVVADPKTCGWTTCTYYFGKAATRDIANGGAGLSACGAIALLGLPGKILGAICAVNGAAVVVQANRAVNRKMCL
jgi:hypothetical protein